MNQNIRNIGLWVLIGILVLALFTVFQKSGTQSGTTEISYSQLLTDVDSGRVRDVTITGQDISGHYQDGHGFTSFTPPSAQATALTDKLIAKNVSVTAKSPSESGSWLGAILINALPILALIGFWVFMSRQMQGGGGKAMSFGKSKAKLLTEAHGRVTFEDVAGIDEAKEDLQEVVEFLRDPQKFQRLGGRIPRGVLLIGPPGTGKTLTARAVAGEANVPFFTISGSDFVEMFVGVGASRVRDMFEQAKKNAPCIIFIDEIDAVGRHRGAGLGGGNDEREQTLNQLLVEMDGFEQNEGIIIIAATNRADVLDPALLRPGRFDRQIMVPNPDIIGREKILRVHARKVPMAPDVNLKILARGTPGFSGADLMNLINEGALLAARRNKRVVTMQEFEDAKDKVMMGAERKSAARTEETNKLVAYHEAGHAIVSLHVPKIDPLHKVTIIPRGAAGGLTMMLPEENRIGYTLEYCLSNIAMTFGGREAELLVFGKDMVSNGASGDIQQATRLARAMVTQWGMSEKLGRVRYAANNQEVFLGHSVSQSQNMSEETANLIDAEVRRLIEDGEQTARRILSENQHELEALANALLEFETLTGDEVRDLLAGKKIVRDSDDTPSAGVRSSPIPTSNSGRPSGDGLEPQPSV